MRSILLVLFCLYQHPTLFAQTPAYIHYGVREGLPGNLVYCGLQDRRGLLWFGTDKGLACFDGVRFRTYGLSDGLPDLEVLKMKEDSHGRIWLSCFRQKPCYWYNGKIYTEKQDSLLASIEFAATVGSYTVSEDDSGRLWFFAGTNKTYYTDWKTLTKCDYKDWMVDLQKVGQDYLMFGGGCIKKLNQPDSLAPLLFTPGRNFLPYIGVIGTRIVRTFPERIELLEWNGQNIHVIDSIMQPSGPVFIDHLGQFWVCTPAAGAVCFQNQKGNFSNPVIYVPNKKLSSMFEDTQGTLWFCTSDEGVFGLPKNAALNFERDYFPSKNIRSIARTHQGYILVGDDIGNVHVINGTKKKTIPFGSIDGHNLIRQIIPVGRDSFWAASDEGLYLYPGLSGKVVHYPRRESYKSILVQGNIVFFAASSSLGYIKPSDSSASLVIKKRFTALGTDSQGIAWAGNMEGLYSQSDSFQINWGDEFSELKSKITFIQKAGKELLWVVTPENGLLRCSTRKGKILYVEIINKFLNKQILNIQSIFTAENGDVWMATNKGIYGLTQGNQVWHFDRYQGIIDDDANCLVVEKDTIWVGTVSGLTKIVKSYPIDADHFKTFVSSLEYKSGDQTIVLNLLDSLAHKNEIVLDTDAKNIELRLAGLDYCSRGNLQFDIEQNTLLLPFHKWTVKNLFQWLIDKFKRKNSILHLESQLFNLGDYLPPGRYQIQVTAINASGIRSQHTDNWVILKNPHWYEVCWFYLLLLFILTACIRQYYKTRIAYREAKAHAATLQLQALQGQMNPHFIGNAINAIQQFLHQPDPIKASEYIALFTRLLRRTMLLSDKTFIPFSEELLNCQEYFKLTELRFGEKLIYSITGADEITPDIQIPTMLLQPLLENATTHGLSVSGYSSIELRFKYEQELLYCIITDNGLGIKEVQRLKNLSIHKRKSKGLDILNKKINAINRLYNLDLNLSIQDLSELDEMDFGTRVTITFTPEKTWKAAQILPENQA